MGHEEHEEDQLANSQYTTGHVENTRKGGEFLGNVMTHVHCTLVDETTSTVKTHILPSLQISKKSGQPKQPQ